MDCEIKKIKHVYHSLNGVSSTIDVFVQLKPALAGQVLYMYIYNSTIYYINVCILSSSVTMQSSVAANHLYTIQPLTTRKQKLACLIRDTS